jgi:hypothetical protein
MDPGVPSPFIKRGSRRCKSRSSRAESSLAGRCVPIAVALWVTACAHAAGFAAILGGAGQDYASSVKSDAQGNTYVAGLTYSPDFRVTPGALQTKAGGGSDAFVAKFAPDGTLLWSTYSAPVISSVVNGASFQPGIESDPG